MLTAQVFLKLYRDGTFSWQPTRDQQHKCGTRDTHDYRYQVMLCVIEDNKLSNHSREFVIDNREVQRYFEQYWTARPGKTARSCERIALDAAQAFWATLVRAQWIPWIVTVKVSGNGGISWLEATLSVNTI